MKERRRAHRYEVWFPVQIDTQVRKERIGINRNASASGILFGSPSKFEVGDKVSLTFKVSSEAQNSFSMTGKVVRSEYDYSDSASIWRYLSAVQFDSPSNGLESVFASLS